MCQYLYLLSIYFLFYKTDILVEVSPHLLHLQSRPLTDNSINYGQFVFIVKDITRWYYDKLSTIVRYIFFFFVANFRRNRSRSRGQII